MIISPDSFSQAFPLDERELLAGVMTNLMDKFENIVLIVAHPTPEGAVTGPVTASFWGSEKFKSNVAKKMYNEFYKEDL